MHFKIIVYIKITIMIIFKHLWFICYKYTLHYVSHLYSIYVFDKPWTHLLLMLWWAFIIELNITCLTHQISNTNPVTVNTALHTRCFPLRLNGQFTICLWGNTSASRWTEFGLLLPAGPCGVETCRTRTSGRVSESSAGIFSFHSGRSASLLISPSHQARFLEDSISSTSTSRPEHFVPDTAQHNWSPTFTVDACTHILLLK